MRITFLTKSLEPPTYDKVYRRHQIGRVVLARDEVGSVTGFTLFAYCGEKQETDSIPVGGSVEPAGVVDCATCAETVKAIAETNK